MGYGNRGNGKGKRKGNYKNKKKYSKKDKTITEATLEGAVDTRLEERMLEIAQKQVIPLIYRKRIFCQYNEQTGQFETEGGLSYQVGFVREISDIPKADFNQPLAGGPVDDPNTDEKEDVNLGATQGMMTQTHQQHRISDIVRISGFTLGLRLRTNMIKILQNSVSLNEEEEGNTFVDVWSQEPFQEFNQKGYCVVHYKILAILDPNNSTDPDADPQDDVFLPPINTVIPIHSYGYSPQLDLEESQRAGYTKKKVFMSGSVRLNYFTNRIGHKEFVKYVKLKTPFTLNFLPRDQNGKRLSKWKVYLALRSNTNDEELNPKWNAFVKVHYNES